MIKKLWRRLFGKRAVSRPGTTNGESLVEPVSDPSPAFDRDTASDFLLVLFGGEAADRADLSPEEGAFLDEMEKLLGSREVVNLVPRLSGSLPRLLSMLREEKSVHELSEQIATDAVLVANVIKMVNSPFYRIRKEAIETIEQSIVILGEKGLREVIASVTLRPVMQAGVVAGIDESLATSLWDEAQKCALSCRSLGDLRQPQDNFALYLCGLTHSVGLTAILRRLALSSQIPQFPVSKPFLDALNLLYPRISYRLILEWEFPQASLEIMKSLATSSSERSPAANILADGIKLARAHSLATRGFYTDEEVQTLLQKPDFRRVWQKTFISSDVQHQ